MKNLYKFLLALLMVAASAAGNKATAQNQSYFEYSTNCLKVSLWATDKRAFDSCATVKFTLNGTYVTGPQATYTFTTAGTYQVCMKILNSCKKWDTMICKNVTVKGCDKCNWSKAAWSYSVNCRKITVEGNNLTGSCYKYTWSVDNSYLYGRVAYYNAPRDGVYKICMKVYDSCHNCDTIICKEVTVKCNECDLKPEINWKNDCLKAKFYGSGGPSGATYYWSFGNGHYATGKDVYHNYVKTGVYKVCLKMVWKDPNTGKECKAEVCKEIKIICGNDCHIKGDFKFATNGNLVKFDASSNNGVYYSWNFGDGTTGSGQNPSHYYKKPGIYEVCVTIYDKTKKCSVKICKKVVIEDKCNVRAYFSHKTSGNTAYFSGIAYNGDYYVWDFGDGTYGTGHDPKHVYTKAGTYKVCLTVYSKNRKCKTTICKNIVINIPDTKCNWAKLGVNFAYNLQCPKLILEGKNLNINTTGCYSYKWSVTPSGTNQSTYFYGRTQSITFNSNGVFNVCMRVYDSCHNCDTIICKTITVNCNEKCNWEKAGFGYSVQCKKAVFEGNYPGSNTGCYKYNWTINGKYFTGRIVDYAFPANGSYEVCMKVTDTCHKCDTVICKKVLVNCNETPKCDWSKAAWSYKLDCRKLTFEGNNLLGACYKYGFSINGTVQYSRTGTYTFPNNGTYKVCMKVYDSCHNCDTTICKEIKVDCNPCSWVGHGFYYKVDCNKVYLEGKVTNNTCVKYVFSTGNNFIGGGRLQDYTFKTNGSYTICMKVVDTCKNCDTVFCQTVKIDCQPCKAQAKFTVDSSNSGGIAYITNHSTGAAYYSWDFGDGTYGYSQNPGKHAYASSGSYTLCLTVYDSAKTCSTKYCVTIKIIKTRAAAVSNISELPVIKLYPNPADANFTISTTANSGKYEVVNLQGKVLATGSLNQENSISTMGWSEGVYLVRSTFNEGVVTNRLVITRQ